MSVAAPTRPRVSPEHAGDGAWRAVAGQGAIPAGSLRDELTAVPDRRGERRTRRHLRPVERPGRRRSPAVPVLVGVGMVIASLFALAAMHALLISGQVRLDGMRRDVASEHEQIRRLELRVAELESPGRVLDAARERLGMVQPTEVGYLVPGEAGAQTDGSVRVAPAEAPPEPDPLDTELGEAGVEEVDEPTDDTRSDGSPSDPAAASPADDRPGEGGRDE